ncbi:hypothetical protein ABZ917_40645 [Nonomuraea wenchangensis]
MRPARITSLAAALAVTIANATCIAPPALAAGRPLTLPTAVPLAVPLAVTAARAPPPPLLQEAVAEHHPVAVTARGNRQKATATWPAGCPAVTPADEPAP